MLIVNNISIANDEQALLNNISFTARRGECLGIIGASGSGKSILANALLRSLPVDFKQTGDIHFATPEYSSLAIVAQAASVLNPSSKIKSQLSQMIKNAGCKHSSSHNNQQRLQVSLAQASISDSVLPLYPYQLSGGMAKRVLTALALVQDSHFVVADEPTCGLDLSRATAVFKQLANLCKGDSNSATQAKGVIIISHDLLGLSKIADRILVLRNGEIVDQTTPALINQGIATQYTLGLWRAHPANWPRRNNAKAH